MPRPSELQTLLDLATAEMLLAHRSAELARKNLNASLRALKRKYPKMAKGIARVERKIQGLTDAMTHLQGAEDLMPIAKKVAELEERPVSGISDELLPIIAPGANAPPVAAGTTSAPTSLGDVDR